MASQPTSYSIFGRAAAAVNMQTGISFVALISVRSAGQSTPEATGSASIFNIMFNNFASSCGTGHEEARNGYVHIKAEKQMGNICGPASIDCPR